MTGLVRLIQGICAVRYFIYYLFQINKNLIKLRVVHFQHLMVLLLIGVHQVNAEEWVDLFIRVQIFN